MRLSSNFIKLLLILLPAVALAQNSYRVNPNTSATSITEGQIVLKVSPVSNIKYPKIISNALVKKYVGFGNLVHLPSSDTVILFCRAATGHLTGGVPVYNIYSISGDRWSGFQTVRTDTADNRDTWAIYMPELDSIVVWSDLSVGPGGNYSQIYQLRYHRNLSHTDTINFRFPASWPRLQYSFIYGKPTHSDTAGYYMATMAQFNIDTGDLTKYRIDVIRTHDYFRTYDMINVYAGNLPFSESSIEYLGSGKYGLLGRLDGHGTLRYFESSNYGVSWTNHGVADSMYWYYLTSMTSPYMYRANDSMVHIFYGNRDNNFVELSPFNKISEFVGGSMFKPSELYFQNKSEDYLIANTSLNYAAMVPIINDSVHLVTWTHESAPDTAFMYYTRDNFKTDPAGVPPAPPDIAITDIDVTSFRLEITGYTQEQLNNIRTFDMDVSTSSNFSSFVTAKYFPTNTSVLHNIRFHSLWDLISSLASGTTYYVRLRACNNRGCSAFTVKSITTLSL